MLASMQSLSLGCTLRTRKVPVPTRIFGNVRRPVLRIITNNRLRCSADAA